MKKQTFEFCLIASMIWGIVIFAVAIPVTIGIIAYAFLH